MSGIKYKILPLTILVWLAGHAQPATPSGYNFINSKYDWLEGKFRTLHIPAGGASQTLYGGWTGAGAPYWDSVGKKLYIWDGGQWQAIGSGGSPTVGTASQRLALSPTNGLEFFQTDDARNAPAGKYWYLNGIWNYNPMSAEDFWYYFNDFSSTSHTTALSATNNLNNEVSGTGATIGFTTGNSFYYGLMSTGTTSTGFAKVNAGQTSSQNAGIQPSTMNVYYSVTIQSVSQKANQVDNFNIDCGIFPGGNTNPQGSGFGFRYDSTTSANWLYRNGAGGYLSTGVAFAANTSYALEVFVRSDSVFYWINNSRVAAEATNGGTSFYTPYTRIVKTLGTTACTMTVDYIKAWARLTSSRTNYGN